MKGGFIGRGYLEIRKTGSSVSVVSINQIS
jgi:hypothetical protein